MGLAGLVLGLALFIGAHGLTTERELRAELIKRFGESAYKIVYSLVSLLAIALIAWGFARYRADGFWPIWQPPAFMRHITIGLMLPAAIMLVASYLRGRIYSTLKHPMLASVKLWAFAHLLSNGDLGGIILFGSFLGWAVYDRISLKHRSDPGGPPIPVGGITNDILAVVVGIVVYLALGFVFHPAVIGVRVFGA